VLGTGLAAVLAPRSMEAARARTGAVARRLERMFMVLMAAGGLAYLAVVGGDWAWNPMARIVPPAYDVAGLVAVTVAANLGSVALFLPVNEFMGAEKTAGFAAISWASSPLLILVALTARTTEAFARPLGLHIDGAARLGAYRVVLRRHYART